jgi:hypothetical protein
MGFVQDYWSGVYDRLDAEVNVLARLIAHAGERGREHEVALQRVLESFLPGWAAVGTGFVVDSSDRTSRQTDLLVYDRTDEPSMFAQTTQLLFPVEIVHSAVEVKSKLSREDLKNFPKVKAALNKLRPVDIGLDTEPPSLALFAYGSSVSTASIAKWLRETDSAERPDAILVLNSGFVGGHSVRLIPERDGDVPAGVALLQSSESPDGWVKAADGTGAKQAHEGRMRWTVRLDGERFLADSARALLLFLEAILRNVHERTRRRGTVLSAYLDERARTVLPI